MYALLQPDSKFKLYRFAGFLVSVLLLINLLPLFSQTLPVTYKDVSSTHLPLSALGGNSMDARPVDIDGDNDLDIVVACEFCPNIILINDGAGFFANESSARLPQPAHDSEDIGIADFDRDGDPDIIFVSEDDQVNEFYINSGNGFFTDFSGRITVTGVSNAVLVAFVDTDTFPDIIIGNAGQNVVMINDGTAHFIDETSQRLPANLNTTQDLEWGDVDGDGDNDLVEGNENGNRLLLNDGSGVFTDVTATQLPLPASGEETREADFGDVDNDGDLDLFLANVTFTQVFPAQNRLLLNDGNGVFNDVTATNLPAQLQNTVDGDFIDLDYDGDLDIVTAQAFNGTYQVLLNDSTGVFSDFTIEVFQTLPSGSGVDVEAADFTGDGLLDLYLAGFQHTDFLYLGEETANLIDGAVNGSLIHRYRLMQNYPNPFNPATTIEFQIPGSEQVTLKIFNLFGQEVATLVSGKFLPGRYRVDWNASGMPSGVYFYRLSIADHIQTRKMLLLK
jgi:hypothetical protein